MANTYDIGDLIRITGTFVDVDGAEIDPTTVVAKFEDPSGNETSYTYGVDAELVKSDTGVYYFDIDIDEKGVWRYRQEGSGNVGAAAEGWFYAREGIG